MALKKSDILEHKNSNYPIVSSLNTIGGHHEVNDVSARNSIPLLKRRIRMLVSYYDGSSEITKKFIGVSVDDVTWSDEGSWVIIPDKNYVDSVSGGGFPGFELKNDAETSLAGFGTDGLADTFQQTLGANTIYAGLIGTDTIAFGPPTTNTLTGGNNVLVGVTDFTSASSIANSVIVGTDAHRLSGCNYSTYVGYKAGENSIGDYTTAIGYRAQDKAGGSATNGIYIGAYAGSGTGIGTEMLGNGLLIINGYLQSDDKDNSIIFGEMKQNAPGNQSLYFNAGKMYMRALPNNDPGQVDQLYKSGGNIKYSLGGECITGDALISLTENTRIRFDELVNTMEVLTYNKAINKNEIKSIEEVISREHTSLIRVELENGVVIKSTLSHPWMSEGGWVSFDVAGALEYYDVETILFSIGTKLKMKDNSVSKIVAYNTFEELQTTYHIKGVENNNYYANEVLTAAMQ